MEVHNVDWEKARSGIYASLVTRNQQDTHFLFVHIALYTDLVTSKFTEKKNSKIENQKSKILNLLTNLLKTSKLKIPYFVDSVLKRRD